MNNNQKGVSVIEILIILAVIIVIGLVGYLFYNNFANSSDEQSNGAETNSQTQETRDAEQQQPEQVDSDIATDTDTKPETKSFKGGYGVNWVSFDYPADWQVSAYSQADDIVGPSIIIKSPDYKIVRLTQSEGPSGNHIILRTTKAYDASLAKYKKDQGSANPLGSWGHFTFAGKPALIFRSTTAQDTKSPPVATISDMYKGESTWVQGKNVIYTFYASRGSSTGKGDTKHLGNAQELYDAIRTVLDSWQWK